MKRILLVMGVSAGYLLPLMIALVQVVEMNQTWKMVVIGCDLVALLVSIVLVALGDDTQLGSVCVVGVLGLVLTTLIHYTANPMFLLGTAVMMVIHFLLTAFGVFKSPEAPDVIFIP